MRNPFQTMLKASRLVRKGRAISAGLALQKLVPTAPRAKKAKQTPKRAKPSVRAKARTYLARPAPGTFVDGRYGGLPYKLYTPVGSNRRRMPLFVMLHGCTQTAAGFARSTRMNELADEVGFVVLYPEQAASANFARCWNWHSPTNQLRGAGEPAAIADLTRHALAATRANPARVYIAGISAGGAAAAIIGAAYPELYAAVGVHSGLSRGTITSLTGAMLAMRDGIDPSASVGRHRSRCRPSFFTAIGTALSTLQMPKGFTAICGGPDEPPLWRSLTAADPPEAGTILAPDTPAAARCCWRSGQCMAAATPGPGAALRGASPILPAQTPPVR
jgi:poly(hydroxyalkanoate) depolymerase family esterase